ncbi:ribosome-recycling factor, mitochondrial-like [Ptychodera flava]|uniref:ribosome-recycling factor, mitochondrial-like n=1 Tax=Ptychodera flava TaxID=63121 RepID=UPI00396AADDA
MSSIRIARHLYSSGLVLRQCRFAAKTRPVRTVQMFDWNSTSVLASSVRFYAKKGKKHTPKVDLSQSADEDILDLQEVKDRMQTVIDHLKDEYVKQLSVRTSPGSLDHIIVTTKDGRIPLNQLGQISMKSSQKFTINMSGFPQAINGAMKAISESGMNLNPQLEGNIISVPIPKVTKEHRESLAKAAKTMCDKSKVNIRNVRSKVMNEVKRHKDHVSKDTVRLLEKQVQQITDNYNENAERLLSAKTKELLGK